MEFKGPEMNIELIDPTRTFLCRRARQSPIHWQEEIKSEVDKLLREGIVKKWNNAEKLPRYQSPATG